MSTALVLEGGGMRGMYTSGVLDVMLEREIPVDGIWGELFFRPAGAGHPL